jgi:uncharacterized damage-inducible protein DinB
MKLRGRPGVKRNTNDVLKRQKMMTLQLETSRAFIAHASNFLVSDYLPKIERCLEKLTDEQIWWRANKESNSIGNLILHLCGNARQWIICGVGARPDTRDRDSEFAQREIVPREQLVTLLHTTLREVQTTLHDLDPSVLLEHRKIQGNDVEILEAIFHVTEHFSMHTGQIIMLTKMFTSSDLRFYEFEDDVPAKTWQSDASGSS